MEEYSEPTSSERRNQSLVQDAGLSSGHVEELRRLVQASQSTGSLLSEVSVLVHQGIHEQINQASLKGNINHSKEMNTLEDLGMMNPKEKRQWKASRIYR